MAKLVTGESAGVFGSYTSMVLPQLGTGFPTPAVPGSTTPVTNTSPVAATVVITGGTMTNVSVNGLTAGAGAGTYTVPAGGFIALTYTVAPTWAWSFTPVFLAAKNANGTPVSQTGAG